MESQQILTFLFGAGSAGSVVGAIILYRLKKSWDNVDQIPILIKEIRLLTIKVEKLCGKMETYRADISQNSKDIAVVDTKVKAAWKTLDRIREL